jgi:MFS family permease
MAVSQSVVGRTNAEKPHGLKGFVSNPYVFFTCLFASLGCIMYGYDQGVMSPILVMENFENHFPLFMGSTIQGWLVAALELGAWAGALINGVLADRISRKYAMMVAVIIFTLGTGLQAGAQTPAYFFAGRIIGGIGIGMFSMVIPLYQAEIAPPELRGSLVSLQQLSITVGTAVAFWLDYGMQFVGGVTCNPEGVDNPYLVSGTYNAAQNHGHTCLGQKTIAWRLPLALQIIPAWVLFFGLFFFPFSPRWLMMKHRDEEAKSVISRLRRLPENDPLVQAEYLEIKAAVMFDEETERELVGAGGVWAPWKSLFAPNMLKRLVLGCGMMIFQQFTGINAVLYYAPQIFSSVCDTSSLLEKFNFSLFIHL